MSAPLYTYGVPAHNFNKAVNAYNAFNRPVMGSMAQKFGPEFVNSPVYQESDEEGAVLYTLFQFAVQVDDDDMVDVFVHELDANPHPQTQD